MNSLFLFLSILVKLSGAPLPEDFRGAPRAAQLDTIVPKDLRSAWAQEWELRLERRRDMAWRGDVLLSSDADAYFAAVLDSVLVGQPALRARLRVHLSPSPFVNAYVLTDGTIMVNQGMMARLETEAQLAMVLAHEASHYWFHHLPDEWTEEQRQKSSWNWGSVSERWGKTRLQHSRNREMSADSMGAAYFLRSRYSTARIDTLYGMLGASDNPLGTRVWDRSALAGLKAGWDDSAWMDPARARSAPVDIVDSLETHPAIPKRREAMALLLKGKSGASEFLVSTQVFARLKQRAREDLPARFLETNQPAVAAFEAWSQLEKSPNHKILRQVMARALVELSLEKAAIRNGTPRARRVHSFGAYQTFEHFLEHSPGLLLPCLALDQMRRLGKDGLSDTLDAALVQELWAVFPKAWPRQTEVILDSLRAMPRSLRSQKEMLALQRRALQPLPTGAWTLPDSVEPAALAKGTKVLLLPVQWGSSPSPAGLGGRTAAESLLGQDLSNALQSEGVTVERADPSGWRESDASLAMDMAQGMGWIRERMDARGISRFRPRLLALRAMLARHQAQGLLVACANLAPATAAEQAMWPLGVSLWGDPSKVWDDNAPALMVGYFDGKDGAAQFVTVKTTGKPVPDRLLKDSQSLVQGLMTSKH
jgi:Peptidase family M48